MAEQEEAERATCDELSVEGKLIKMYDFPQSADTEILKGINDVLSPIDIESFSVNGEFFSTLRDFLLCNRRWDSDGNLKKEIPDGNLMQFCMVFNTKDTRTII